MSDFAIGRQDGSALAPGSAAEALVFILVALALVAVSVAAFIVSTPLGIGAGFVLTLGLAIARPASTPIVIVAAFLFQNTIIAVFTPLVQSDAAFDTLRGANFVILVTAYAAFTVASFQQRAAAIPELRPWILGGGALLLVICLYLGLGAINGEPKDAIVYFRNTLTPLACFHVALVAAALYRIDIARGILWLGVAAVAYGYCELFFTTAFLGLFNGDQYIERQMAEQIATGYWEKALQQTGFVLRGLQDVMTTSFFNTPFFADLFPAVWRLAGPNFHPISYAYALSLVSAFFVFRGRWALALLALPLLLVIGSKGAMALLLLAIFARVTLRFLGPRWTTALVLVITTCWIAAAVIIGMRTGDYHVLGFFAGIRDFLSNPTGHGLGIGGNTSSSSLTVDWDMAQATGGTTIAVESAVGVMLYQMGIGAFAFFGFLAALAAKCRQLFLRTGDQAFLFAFVSVVMIGGNAVMQEEAFYSPLALGLCLLLTGLTLGSHWRERKAASFAGAAQFSSA